jgi:hypothetical protein
MNTVFEMKTQCPKPVLEALRPVSRPALEVPGNLSLETSRFIEKASHAAQPWRDFVVLERGFNLAKSRGIGCFPIENDRLAGLSEPRIVLARALSDRR